jgi:hypothetical protein
MGSFDYWIIGWSIGLFVCWFTQCLVCFREEKFVEDASREIAGNSAVDDGVARG